MIPKKIILLTLATIFLAGCSVVSNDNPGLFSGTRDYKMEIVKSEVNINTIEFVAEKNLSVKNLLKQSGVEYKMRGDGKLRELDGVIATASREWNIYIDDTQADLNTIVCNKCQLKWQYENLNN
ncbi:MAG: hypothetical protein HOD54_01350 [Candidatus Magasanikbacteria bacterium]|jgi:hypothetical protein|nr:hypothetical protein [Candidatus Magasanikbacteria bacterium]MBT4314717.1 hypothetical protein [Candidatus Magasanikbacteria bacterium]MBT4547494.1 hypothetical protein [Candidatus Magasanikbacteria bacterium]